MATYKVFLAIFIAVGVSAVPYRQRDYDSTDRCARTCSGSNDKLQYQPGTTYIYSYEVTTDTHTSDGNSVKLAIESKAEIEAGDNCDFTLRLQDVHVFHSVPYKNNLMAPEREQEFQQALQRNALRFSFDDGVIKDVCPDDSEDVWPLNFKKGLLSAFQNSMEDFHRESQIVKEIDVTGDCEAEYNISKSWGWRSERTIKKSKDLMGCSQRDGFKGIIQIVPYQVPSDIQSLPIVKSSHRCEYTISSQRFLKTAECKETHAIKPFNQNSGVQTDVKQKLTYVNHEQRTSGSSVSVERRQSLLFNHENSKVESSRQSAEQKLKEICEQTKLDIRPETPRLFTDLIESIKGLDFEDVQQIYSQLQKNVICPENDKARKFFEDALPMTGTLGPIKMMVKLLNDKEVDGVLAQAWIASLSFIKDATEETVKAVKPLLTGPHSEAAKLPVTSVVSTLCRKDSSCQSSYYVKEVIQELAKPIGYRCSVNDRNRLTVLRSLKALGNIRGLSDKATLDKCLTSSRAPLEVKVAAADAYRRSECPQMMDKDQELWNVLKDSSSDIELRIVSYQAIMRCPEQSTLEDVVKYLEEVKEEQIGAYMYSHLLSLKDTSDPHKQDLAQMVRGLELPMIDLNAVKHSRNYEASFIVNKLNLGATIDSDLILSPSAPVPRAAKVNLTMDVFGNAVNLLEIGGRVEGLEAIIQRIMGYKLVKKSDLPALEDIRASMYARVFGNEVFFTSVKGSDKLITRDNIPNYLDILQRLSKKQSVAYTYSHQVLDGAIILPTAAGVPLEMHLNGSANLDLHAEGKADVLKLTSKPHSMDIDGEIRPSAAMEISADMRVNALVTKVGLRIRNTMHSSTEVKARININRGRVLSVEVDAPRDKMEIFQAKSEFLINYNGIEKELNVITDNSHAFKKCTGDMAAKITGAELCMELDRTSFSVKLNKRDTQNSYKFIAKHISNKKNSITQFQVDSPGSKTNRYISTDITLGYSPDTTLDIQIMSPWKKVDFNTGLVLNKDLASFTGSALIDDRDKYKVTTEVKYNRNSKTKEMTFTPFVEISQPGQTLTLVSGQVVMVPKKKMEVNLEVKDANKKPYNIKAELLNTGKEERVKVSVSSNGKDEYLFNLGNKYSYNKAKKVLNVKPELEVKTPTQKIISVDGSVTLKQDISLNGQLTAQVLSKKPASISWNLSTKQDKKGKTVNLAKFKVKSSVISANLDSTTTISTKGQISSRVKCFYNIPKVSKNMFTWTAKYSDLSKNAFKKYSLKTYFTNKKYPDYNVGLTAALNHKRKQSAADVEIKYGKNPKDKSKIISLSSSLKRDVKSMSDADVAFKTEFKMPSQNVDMQVNARHSHDPQTLDSKMNLKFKPFLEDDLDLDMSLRDKSRNLFNYNGIANLKYGKNKLSVGSTMLQKSKTQYIHNMNMDLPGQETYRVNTIYKIPGKSRHQFVSTITMPNKRPIEINGKANFMGNSGQITGSIINNKDVYSLNAFSKVAKREHGKWGIEAEIPSRRIEMYANAKNMHNKYDGDVTLNWDAHKKFRKASEIKFGGSLKNQDSEDSRLFNLDLDLTTPFENAKALGGTFKYLNDPQQANVLGKLSWGGKTGKLSSNMVVKKPLTFTNAQVSLKAVTPLKYYREVDLNLDHKLDGALATLIKAVVDNEEGELLIQGENKGDDYNCNLSGSMDLKTPFAPLRVLNVAASHNGNSRQTHTSTSINHNGDQYNADLTLNLDQRGMALNHNGQLGLSWPRDRLDASWNHKSYGLQNVDSSLNAKWGRNQRLDITLNGKNEPTWEGRIVFGELDIKTPMRNHREINFKLDHSHSENKISTKGHLINNRDTKMAYDILLEKSPDGKKAIVKIVPYPDSDEINSEMAIQHGGYPKTLSAWLQWTPSSRIDVDGSLNIPSVDNMEVSGKLTSPWRSISATGSHKLDNREYISHANVAFGVRKAIDFENRFRNDARMKMLRTKLTTPFESLQSLDSGVEIDMKRNGVDGRADFEMLPLVRKHDGFVNVVLKSDKPFGKLQLNTPDSSKPYLKVTVSSKKNEDSARTSHLEIVPRPLGAYSLESTYRVVRPYQLDINVKTPHREFDNVGFKVMANPTESNIDAQAVIVYLPGKQIDTILKAKWEDNIDGSLVVKTPFRDYGYNNIILRHNGQMSDFSNHAEIQIGRDNAVSDIIFSNTDRKTSGTAKLTSTLLGSNDIEGNLLVRGSLKNLKGHASISCGSDFVRTVFSNSLKPNQLKSSFSVQTPYKYDLALSLDSELTEGYYGERSTDTTFDASIGENSLNGNLKTNLNGLKDIKIEGSLNSKSDEPRSINFNLEHGIKSNSDMSGKATVKCSLDMIPDVEMSYSKEGSLGNMKAKALVVADGRTLADTLVETNKLDGELHGKFVSQGEMMIPLSVTVDHKGNKQSFNNHIRISDMKRGLLDHEITFKQEDTKLDLEMKYYSKSGDYDISNRFTLNKIGTLSDFNIEVNNVLAGNELTGKVTFKAADKITAVAEAQRNGKKIKAEFDHSGNLERFLTTSRVELPDGEIYSGKIDFYQSGWKRVEFTGELHTPHEGYKLNKVEYRHEGQPEARSSCNINVQYGDQEQMSLDLVLQSQPSPSINFNIKTPFQGYRDMLLAADVDKSTTDAKLIITEDIKVVVKGTHDVSRYPQQVDISYYLTSPLDSVRRLDLKIAGSPSDNSVDVTVKNARNQKTSLISELKYENPFEVDAKFKLNDALRPWERTTEPFKIIVKMSDDPYSGKKSHVEIDQYLIMDGSFMLRSDKWNARTTHAVELELSSPALKEQIPVQKVSGTVEVSQGPREKKTKIVLSSNDIVQLDMDVSHETSQGHKFSTVIREPRSMEYSLDMKHQDLGSKAYSKENTLHLNWDKTEPSSNLKFSSEFKDTSAYSSTEKSLTANLVLPSRTLKVEHTFSSSSDSLVSEGKFYWNDNEDSKVFYELNVSGDKRRQSESTTALVKLGVPTRTIGITGSASDDSVTKKVHTTFSWDMDRDEEKQIGITASLSGRDYTKADITVKMPAELEVSSEVILNQGNTVFDGKTDISYSKDSRKTLTLFSKIQNNQGYSYFARSESGFNYSVELGVRHPETRLDVTLDSHIGQSSNLLTSSLGLQYLTSRRRTVNLALSTEIDKLKKQINLLAVGPNQIVGLSGKVVSEKPLKLEMSQIVDGSEETVTSLNIDDERKEIRLDIGNPENRLRMKAFYPNSSALQADVQLEKDYRRTQQSLFVLRLISPKLLNTRVDWRPEAISEAQEWLVGSIITGRERFNSGLQEITSDIQTELVAKHRDFSEALSEDSKPVLALIEEELAQISRDIATVRYNLRQMVGNNEFYLKDLTEAANSLSVHYYNIVKSLRNLNMEYTESYRQLLKDVAAKLEEIKNYDVRQAFGQDVRVVVNRVIQEIDELSSSFINYLKQLNQKLADIKDSYEKSVVSLRDLYNHPNLDFVTSKISDVRNSEFVTNMQSTISNKIEDLKKIDLEPYKAYVPQYIQDQTREVYDQAKSVYKFWVDEKLMKEKLQDLVNLLKEAIEKEIKQYTDSVKVLVFDPENGKLQFNTILPFPVERLDKLPNLQPYVDRVTQFVEKYRPHVTEAISKVWPSNETSSQPQEIITDLEQFNPRQRHRKVPQSHTYYQYYSA